MALDKLLIGARIRKIREEKLKESREIFVNRCDLNERYIGQIERGEFLLSLPILDKIATATGFDTDYILYGKGENKKSIMKDNLITLVQKADNEQIKMLYKCFTSIMNYVNKRIN